MEGREVICAGDKLDATGADAALLRLAAEVDARVKRLLPQHQHCAWQARAQNLHPYTEDLLLYLPCLQQVAEQRGIGRNPQRLPLRLPVPHTGALPKRVTCDDGIEDTAAYTSRSRPHIPGTTSSGGCVCLSHIELLMKGASFGPG